MNNYRYYKVDDSILFNSKNREWRVLSNMQPCSICHDDVFFQSSEMLFWWLRFQGEGKERQQVRDALISQEGYWNGFNCKKIAKENKHLIDREINEYDCLLTALEEKVVYCEAFREALKMSEDKNLVEYAPWGDVRYGTIYNEETGLYEGVNACGRLMMKVREGFFNGEYPIYDPL